ncbi:CDP-glycerol glycerophosphotransferase family protein [uncultured Pseudodesulfovibrio sp.]|uniref:CDP-glycerol glycerophosphotransferase family protein n=1 Tax=uncultured Pseudodesulfovibrio sp. TaxID=2035858 RepID=UPI0029C8CE5B|nr:CDP-glycerol glycerophosphotransferase family protein [uncultured Pseudodesulfovibrio sp.]
MTHNEISLSYGQIASLALKKPSRVVFIGPAGGRFTGNVKHLFLYCVRHRPEIDAHFFTCHPPTFKMLRDADLPVHLFPDFDAVAHIAEASTIVVDHFNFKEDLYAPLTECAHVIQLWHGVGFKEIGFVEKDSNPAHKNMSLDFEHLYSGYHTVVSTSPFYTQEVFKKSFRAEHFVDLGYPRNDALFQRVTKDSMLNCDYAAFRKTGMLKKELKTVLYVPTFRDDRESSFAGRLDLDRLNSFLVQSGLHLVIKAHPILEERIPDNLPNITHYDNACDVYPFMQLADVMLTDYSSIYMDYLMLNRPVVFFCPDYDRYVTNNRKLQFPYEEMTPGPKCRTQDELHAALAKAASGDDGYEQERIALRDKAFLHPDGDSSRRVADYLCKIMPD